MRPQRDSPRRRTPTAAGREAARGSCRSSRHGSRAAVSCPVMSTPTSRSASGSVTLAHDVLSNVIPPATFRSNHTRPSFTWMGERARRYRSVCADDVGPCACERGRSESVAHQRLGCGRAAQRLRVREVERRVADVVGNRRDRSIELVGDFGLGGAVEQAMACGCASRWTRVRSSRRRAPPTSVSGGPRVERLLVVDERCREVPRRRHAVANQDRQRNVDEIRGVRRRRSRRCTVRVRSPFSTASASRER